VGVKFQGSFTSGIYFRTKVSYIASRVNCQANSSKDRNIKGRGSVGFGLFGLLARKGRVITVGLVSGVVIGPLFVGALGRVRERRNSRHSRGDGSSEVGNVGHTDSGLPATGRTGAAFLPWVPELPVLGLLGRSKLGIHFFRVMLVLNRSDLVNVGLRNKPLASSVGVTPTATTAAGPAATSTATTAACDGGDSASLGNTRFRFLASLGGHIHVHHWTPPITRPVQCWCLSQKVKSLSRVTARSAIGRLESRQRVRQTLLILLSPNSAMVAAS